MMRALVALAILLTAGALPAGAQEAREVCTGLESEAAEIACLRAFLADGQVDDENSIERTSPPVSPPPQPAAPAPIATRFGAEQVRSEMPSVASNELAERLDATIVETRRDRRGLLVMQLENGQIWRQNESPAVPFRFDQDGPTRVEITRSGFGGYRMHFPDVGRRMVVSRLR